LRVWNVGKDIHGYWKHVHVDALMVPVEQYQEGIFFQVSLTSVKQMAHCFALTARIFNKQVYIRKGSCIATASAGMLVANGGRYDKLLQKHWTSSSVCIKNKLSCIFH
jgi:ATP phosphoribosyltransferase regulatory subunit HisZ